MKAPVRKLGQIFTRRGGFKEIIISYSCTESLRKLEFLQVVGECLTKDEDFALENNQQSHITRRLKVSDLAKLRIPDDQIETLGTLVGMSDRDTDRLLRVLSDLPLSVDFEASTKALAPKLATLQIKQPNKLLQVLISLSVTRAHADPPINEYVEDVLEAIDESDPKILSGKKKFHARHLLRKLLSFEPLSLAAKASHLLHEQAHLLASSRILTDARPVYGQDPGKKPSGVLINHTLQLTYFDNMEHKEFFVALNAKDIANLKKILDRATAKADSLTDVFKSSNVKIVQS